MAKRTTLYVCQNCGEGFPKWQGQCSNCGEWNTLVEELKPDKRLETASNSVQLHTLAEKYVSFSQVEPFRGSESRFSTGLGELDRVLGPSSTAAHQGLVPGAMVLLGGEPGIGKSTLLTQVVINVANMLAAQAASTNSADAASSSSALSPKALSGKRNSLKVVHDKPETGPVVLYVSGEENPSQISLRINRFLNNEHIGQKLGSGKFSKKLLGEAIVFFTSTNTDEVVAAIEQKRPALVIIDSIQTLQTTDLSGAAGSVGQIRESAERLTQVAKSHNIPCFLVGHVTKEGTIAGPKVLEHIVDAVLELSGERTGQLRILRAIKNRFGATDEVGVFQVMEWGLEEVANPSALFLEHTEVQVPGSATICVMEGTRPLVIEVQALVVASQLAMPRRVGRGIELSRIQVLSAVLQKHSRLPLGTTDIFVNAAGGFTVREPALDLGLAVAIASSLKNKPVPPKAVFIGEVGLLGEIRAVSYLDKREKEAKRLGFQQVFSRNTHKNVSSLLKEINLI